MAGRRTFRILTSSQQSGSVALVTRLRAGRTRYCGSIPARSKIFYSARRPDLRLGPPSPLLNVCQKIFLRGQSGRGVKLAIYLHLVRGLRMRVDLTFPTTVCLKERTRTTLHYHAWHFLQKFAPPFSLHSLHRASWYTYVGKTNNMHTFLNNLFRLIYPLNMFRTGNSSSSGGVLYKQLTAFHRAS